MRRPFPVLVLIAGLGSCFSFARNRAQSDPFDRYIAGLRVDQPEAALMRFAGDCGVNVKTTSPRYADRPDNSWVRVNDPSKGIHGLETDFFATVLVWKESGRVLVEVWVMELDVGSESRDFYCLNTGKIMMMEVVDWTLPVTDEDGKVTHAWGYKQRWKVMASGRLDKTFHGFVDTFEKPIASPQMDVDTRRRLDWLPKVRTWDDLELPNSLLR